MSKVIMINHLTLDGVVQAPGRAEEDRAETLRTAAGLNLETTTSWRR